MASCAGPGDDLVEHLVGQRAGPAQVGAERGQRVGLPARPVVRLDHGRLEAHAHPAAVGSDDGPRQVRRLPPPLALPVHVPAPGHPQVGAEDEAAREVDEQVLAPCQQYVGPRDAAGHHCGNNGENPAKDGVASAGNLDRYTQQSIFPLTSGYVAFAGQRDDGFYADIQSVFDLLKLRNPGKDSQGGFNLHLMALAIPVSELGGDMQVVGVYGSYKPPAHQDLDR